MNFRKCAPASANGATEANPVRANPISVAAATILERHSEAGRPRGERGSYRVTPARSAGLVGRPESVTPQRSSEK